MDASPNNARLDFALHVDAAPAHRRPVALDRCDVTRCATRLGLICLVRRGSLPRGLRCGGHQTERDGAEQRSLWTAGWQLDADARDVLDHARAGHAQIRPLLARAHRSPPNLRCWSSRRAARTPWCRPVARRSRPCAARAPRPPGRASGAICALAPARASAAAVSPSRGPRATSTASAGTAARRRSAPIPSRRR
jgi:hypothetical protein